MLPNVHAAANPVGSRTRAQCRAVDLEQVRSGPVPSGLPRGRSVIGVTAMGLSPQNARALCTVYPWAVMFSTSERLSKACTWGVIE